MATLSPAETENKSKSHSHGGEHDDGGDVGDDGECTKSIQKDVRTVLIDF